MPPGWAAEHFVPGGLSSGEGIIWAVRDPIPSRDKKSGEESRDRPRRRGQAPARRRGRVRQRPAPVRADRQHALQHAPELLGPRHGPGADQELPAKATGAHRLCRRAHHAGRAPPLSRPHRARQRLRQPAPPRLREAVAAAAVRRVPLRRTYGPPRRHREGAPCSRARRPASGGSASRCRRRICGRPPTRR